MHLSRGSRITAGLLRVSSNRFATARPPARRVRFAFCNHRPLLRSPVTSSFGGKIIARRFSIFATISARCRCQGRRHQRPQLDQVPPPIASPVDSGRRCNRRPHPAPRKAAVAADMVRLPPVTQSSVRQESWQRVGGESLPRGRFSQPPRPRVMHEVLLARAAVKRSQGRPRAEY